MVSKSTRKRAVCAAGIVMVVTGCPSAMASIRGALGRQSVPTPALTRVVPAGYRIVHVYRANLSGSGVPDIIVTSTRQPPQAGVQHADLQVISWEPRAHRWAVIFDAQKTLWPASSEGPQGGNSSAGYPYGLSSAKLRGAILDPKAPVEQSVDQVRFPRLLGTRRQQLVFSATDVGAGGMQGILAVVSVEAHSAKLIYAWDGEGGLGAWRIVKNIIYASADYFTPIDSLCCPVRTYRFAIGERDGAIKELSDDRPFLGVIVRGIATDLVVIRVVPGTPAAGRLHVGDILVDVENAPAPSSGAPPPSNTSIFDQLSRLRAGAQARLLIDRNRVRIAVTVRLGSLDSPAAASLRTPTTNGSTNVL
jgi:hypothetical protein